MLLNEEDKVVSGVNRSGSHLCFKDIPRGARMNPLRDCCERRTAVAKLLGAYFPLKSTGKKFHMVRHGSDPALGLLESRTKKVNSVIGT